MVTMHYKSLDSFRFIRPFMAAAGHGSRFVQNCADMYQWHNCDSLLNTAVFSCVSLICFVVTVYFVGAAAGTQLMILPLLSMTWETLSAMHTFMYVQFFMNMCFDGENASRFIFPDAVCFLQSHFKILVSAVWSVMKYMQSYEII